MFIREVAQARDIVDERLGTRGRSVLLVNHAMALDEVPLASVTNLDIVLGRLGRIMRPEKDTLILFLTSHGIENMFGVQFPPFPLNHLTPPRLRRDARPVGHQEPHRDHLGVPLRQLHSRAAAPHDAGA